MSRATTPGRVFLVGCPRSGTTILQSALARHPVLATFPESHFFDQVVPRTRRSLRRLGLVSNHSWQAFLEFAAALDDVAQPPVRKPALLGQRAFCRRFIDLLDTAAEDRGCSHWLEKTPGHSAHIPAILRCAPDARFVHIIREPGPVVASLQRVSAEHPETWGPAWDFDKCLARWQRAIDDSITHGDDPARHLFVVFEEFARAPEPWLALLREFLDLPAAVTNIPTGDNDHILATEPWKSRAAGPVEYQAPDLDGQFDPQQAARIEQAAASSGYRPLRERALQRLAATAADGKGQRLG